MKSDIKIQVLGIEEMDYILKNLPRRLNRKLMISTFRKAAKPLIKAAKGKVKVNSDDSGTLRKSIGGRPDRYNKSEPVLIVGPRVARTKHKAWYAHFIEFGTQRKEARPFMRPAYDTTHNEVTELIAKELSGVIVKYFKKHAPKHT